MYHCVPVFALINFNALLCSYLHYCIKSNGDVKWVLANRFILQGGGVTPVFFVIKRTTPLSPSSYQCNNFSFPPLSVAFSFLQSLPPSPLSRSWKRGQKVPWMFIDYMFQDSGLPNIINWLLIPLDFDKITGMSYFRKKSFSNITSYSWQFWSAVLEHHLLII